MKAMYPFILLAIGCLVVSGLAAQSSDVEPHHQLLPLASADDQFAPGVNPSLLGTGLNSGLGYAQALNSKEKIRQHWLSLNLGDLAYLYENNQDASNHLFAYGTRFGDKGIMRNIYLGTAYGWSNSDVKEGFWRSGFTFRPHNSASLAMVWDNPYKDSPAYKAGISLRPLQWFMPRDGYRLELSTDVSYKKTLQDYEITDPVIGINTQIMDGLMIGAAYNLDSKNAMLNFGLRFGKASVSSAMVKPDSKDPVFIPQINLTPENFKPFLGISHPKWYDMKLTGSVVSYKAPSYEIGPLHLYDSKSKNIQELIDELQKAADQPGVQGILLMNPSFSTSFALQQELVRAFADFKATGKKVECYYDNISNGGYIFASAVADQIWLNPQGSVDLRGFAITSPYFATLLDSLGVEVLNFRSHKYKSAGNQFSESSMTDAEREVYGALLQSIYDVACAQIASGRGERIKDSVQNLIDQGPYYLAQDALDAGLIDGLIYEDELDGKLKEAHGFTARTGNIKDYYNYDWNIPGEQKIAVIYASGNIVMGKGTPGKVIAAESTAKLIRKARKNPDYKGIILRVDSGGGSAQASDIILRELELAQTKNKKPVVVSMAGAAASGGYYIACKADHIIAEENTLTGSIGVIGLAFNTERLFNKIRVNWSTVKKGKNADFPSLYHKWSEEEKQRMSHYIESFYEDFVKLVDEGRKNLNLEQVHEYAQGRVWTGKQAFELGLVDELGGMEAAVRKMRELTGIKGNIQLVDACKSDKGIKINLSSTSLPFFKANTLAAELSQSYIQLYELWTQYGDQRFLMLSPISSQIIDF